MPKLILFIEKEHGRHEDFEIVLQPQDVSMLLRTLAECPYNPNVEIILKVSDIEPEEGVLPGDPHHSPLSN